jgi:tRNA nucleotidyltransferase (CCA-adding enzyme)
MSKIYFNSLKENWCNYLNSKRRKEVLLAALESTKPAHSLIRMLDSGGFDYCQEILDMAGCSQNRYHSFDVWKHTLLTVDKLATSSDIILKLTAFFHDIGKPPTKEWSDRKEDYTFNGHDDVGANITERILTDLLFDSHHVNRVVHLIKHHNITYTDKWSNRAVRRWIRKVGTENLKDLFRLAKADSTSKGKINENKYMNVGGLLELEKRAYDILFDEEVPTDKIKLEINGRILMEQFELEPGPLIGDILDWLEYNVKSGKIQNDGGSLYVAAMVYLREKQSTIRGDQNG